MLELNGPLLSAVLCLQSAGQPGLCTLAMPASAERLFQALERIQVGWPHLMTMHIDALHGVSRPLHSTAKAPPTVAPLCPSAR